MSASKPPKGLTVIQRFGKKVVYQVKPITLPAAKKVVKTAKPSSKPPAAKPPVVQPDPQLIAAQRQEKIQTMFAWLGHQYPHCFNLRAKKPLQIGIHKELRRLHPEISRRGLARALTAYIRTPDYYKAVATSSHRYDLAGQPCAEITPEERMHAQVTLAKLTAVQLH